MNAELEARLLKARHSEDHAERYEIVYDVQFAELFGALRDTFQMSERDIVAFALGEFELQDRGDSLDFVEFRLRLEDDLCTDFPNDFEIPTNVTYQQLHQIVCEHKTGCVPQARTKELRSKYILGQKVEHKNGDTYTIIELPQDHKRLEDCNEPYYRYVGKDGIEWSRRVSQMEDGRFTAI